MKMIAAATLALAFASSAEAAPPGPRSATPANFPGSWVTTGDYPVEALRDKVEGVTGFRLTVDPAGRVAQCEITSSSGSAVLDARTCQLAAARAQFTPAVDAHGKATQGIYANRVRWVLPQSQRVPEQGLLVVSFIVDTFGDTTDCKIVQAEGGAQNPLVAASACNPRHFAAPYVDSVGRPVRKRVTTRYSVTVEESAP